MRVVFKLPGEEHDYFITWRGGSRLWMPARAPELALLKPELRFELAEALSHGDARLERLAAVSSRGWRELYALARFVEYGEPPEPPATMWYLDPDLAVIAAAGLAARGRRVLLEIPELGVQQAALLAGRDVTVCVSVSSRALEVADQLARAPRGASRGALRAIGLLGGAWDDATLPQVARAHEEEYAWERRSEEEYAAFEEYAPREFSEKLDSLEPPRAREPDPLLDLAFGADANAAFALLRDMAAGPLPLRSVPELGQYAPLLRDLILYGYATVERDAVRLTEKGLFALLQKMGGSRGPA